MKKYIDTSEFLGYLIYKLSMFIILLSSFTIFFSTVYYLAYTFMSITINIHGHVLTPFGLI